MAFLTAARLKARENPEVIVDLGGGDQILARRPDLQTLIFEGLMPTPLLNEVITLISTYAGKDADTVTEEMMQHSAKMTDFVHRWLCAAMVQPRCVMTEAERADDAIVIHDLTLQTKITIFSATFNDDNVRTVEVAAATEFPENGSGAGSGQDSETVRAEAVVAAGDLG